MIERMGRFAPFGAIDHGIIIADHDRIVKGAYRSFQVLFLGDSGAQPKQPKTRQPVQTDRICVEHSKPDISSGMDRICPD